MRPWQWDVLASLHTSVGVWALMRWPTPSWFGVAEIWLGGVCLIASTVAEAQQSVRNQPAQRSGIELFLWSAPPGKP